MLDSVIRARNRWLKPEGTLFPSHSTMYWGLVSYEEDRDQKIREYHDSLYDWEKFSSEMKQYYAMDMTPLEKPFTKEQEDYFVYSGLWTELRPEHSVGQPVVIKKIDLNT